MIIAIDGPAASGKSTVARALARELGLVFLDTGAMYRAVALRALQAGVAPDDGVGCGRIARALELDFDGEGRIRIDGRSGEPAIRSPEVDAVVSRVSAHPEVRQAIVPIQRDLARRGRGVVAEGRDTATVVFPDADHKFFLVASVAERARRRALERGQEHRAAEIQAEIETRDGLDRSRPIAPLVRALDAEVIDTDGRGVEEVVRIVLERVRAAPQP